MRFPAVILFLLFLLASCEGLKKTTDQLFESSERNKYVNRYKGADSLMVQWQDDFEAALNNRLQIPDGFSVTANAGNGAPTALGYTLDLKRGEKLVVEVAPIISSAQIFVNIGDSASVAAESFKIENGRFSKVVEQTSAYRIVVQPEIAFTQPLALKIYTQPSLSFPVFGKGNADVQSFWGAARDGGSRAHEGVDIFAKRGTPVVAATDGFITRTGNTGLGGKQVWLRDGLLGNSLYYAHLDSIIARDGSQVKVGDTLGLVGSTGNAEGGAPHLHFGIYGGGGAQDPYPFIRKRSVPTFKEAQFPETTEVKAGSNLRSGPGTRYETVSTVKEKISAKILASDGEWFHIITAAGEEGFINRGRLNH